MNTQMILASLRARPVRTGVGILAVTLEVVLILLLVGLTQGTVEETGNRVAGVGAEILLKGKDSSFFVGMNPAVIPIKEVGADIRKVEGVVAAAPVVTQTDASGGFTVVYGIDPPTFDAVSGGLKILQGRMFASPHEAVVDDWQAGTKMISVGDTVKVLKKTFTITGIVQNGKGARIFIPMATAQEIAGRENMATMFYIKLKDKSDTPAAIKRLEAALGEGEFDIVDVEEFVALMFASISTLMNVVFNVIVFLGNAVGVLVIFLSMYTTVTERTREIGILRSMGGSKAFIVGLVVQEALVLCFLGTLVGIGSGLLLAKLLKWMLPTLVILITPGWILQASLFALASGVIGSLYPAYKAASQDPIEALAYE